jgi:hypothetical protein
MTATNHFLTGALIGGLVKNPLIALPLAFASHFVLDMLPHYGTKKEGRLNSRYMLVIDVVLSVAALTAIIVLEPRQAILMVACAVVAFSPDLLWLPYLIAELKGQFRPRSGLAYFLQKIQWKERPWGMAVEGVWTSVMVMLLVKLL